VTASPSGSVVVTVVLDRPVRGVARAGRDGDGRVVVDAGGDVDGRRGSPTVQNRRTCKVNDSTASSVDLVVGPGEVAGVYSSTPCAGGVVTV